MKQLQESKTSQTLLAELHANPKDERAWRRFAERYVPTIHLWCRRGGLQGADCDEVTQKVLLSLFLRFAKWRYDPSRSFRGYLQTTVKHAIWDLRKSQCGKAQGSGDDHIASLLLQVQSRSDLFDCLWSETFQTDLLELAMSQVEASVEPLTWQAFVLRMKGMKADEIAKQLNVRIDTVYMGQSRVRRKLQDEVKRLQSETEEDES
jgi:RNA polymerase sigma-70 factor (ECF subfamily)